MCIKNETDSLGKWQWAQFLLDTVLKIPVKLDCLAGIHFLLLNLKHKFTGIQNSFQTSF